MHNPIFNTYHPHGFGTMNAYLFVEEPELLINFLKKSFYAEELYRTLRPETGEIANLILKIGDSSFMISQASGPFLNMRTSFYLYVNDVDKMYERALTNGAKSVFEPGDQEFGDRQGGVEDPVGNYWWISTRLKEEGYQKQ